MDSSMELSIRSADDLHLLPYAVRVSRLARYLLGRPAQPGNRHGKSVRRIRHVGCIRLARLRRPSSGSLWL